MPDDTQLYCVILEGGLAACTDKTLAEATDIAAALAGMGAYIAPVGTGPGKVQAAP